MGCPICARNFYATNRADQVCENHENWIVTVCKRCKKKAFSVDPGECPNCWKARLNNPVIMPVGSKDPISYLKWVGQEGKS